MIKIISPSGTKVEQVCEKSPLNFGISKSVGLLSWETNPQCVECLTLALEGVVRRTDVNMNLLLPAVL